MENITNKIFISYSSDDRDLRQIFEMRLKPYLQSTRNKFDNVWSDKQIPIGSSWNDEIQQALNESNIGILLVSPMFLGSQYSMGDELQKMLERRENGYLIVPVILRECNFTNIPELSSIQLFKTYQSEYEVTDLNRTNQLMPFDELVEVPNPNRKLLNRYFLKLANTIDDAIDILNNKLSEAKNTSQKSKLETVKKSQADKPIELVLKKMDKEGNLDEPSPNPINSIELVIQYLTLAKDFDAKEVLRQLIKEMSDSQKITVSGIINEHDKPNANFNILSWRERSISKLKSL